MTGVCVRVRVRVRVHVCASWAPPLPLQLIKGRQGGLVHAYDIFHAQREVFGALPDSEAMVGALHCPCPFKLACSTPVPAPPTQPAPLPPSLPPSLPPPLPHCRVQRVLACALAKADWLPKGLALPRVGLITALRAWVEANPPPCVAAPAGDVDTAEALLPLARAWLSLILRGKDAPSESLVEGYADAAAERLVADEDDDVLCALLSALEVGFQVQQPIAAPCPPPPLRSSDWLLGEGSPSPTPSSLRWLQVA